MPATATARTFEVKTTRRVVEKEPPRTTDAHVGQRVRQKRMTLGMSQENVAAAIGVTLQQVQKYENGSNRVGASRLWDLAQVFGCDVAYFFEGLDAGADQPATLETEQHADPLTARRETWELVRTYYMIKDGRVRRRLRNLACSLATQEEMLAAR